MMTIDMTTLDPDGKRYIVFETDPSQTRHEVTLVTNTDTNEVMVMLAADVERMFDDARHDRVRQVTNAMELLLTKKQIAYISARTRSGASRREVIRRLLNLGIELDRSNE
jgi:hypothetical protein